MPCIRFSRIFNLDIRLQVNCVEKTVMSHPVGKSNVSVRCGGQPRADRVSASNLVKKKVCETIGPIVNELSRMHEAEVHVFSDTVLCLETSRVKESSIKFIERWKDHLDREKGWEAHSIYIQYLSR